MLNLIVNVILILSNVKLKVKVQAKILLNHHSHKDKTSSLQTKRITGDL